MGGLFRSKVYILHSGRRLRDGVAVFGLSARVKILALLSDGQSWSHREIVKESGLNNSSAGVALYRGWKSCLFLRTAKPFTESVKVFKGRAGTSRTMRPYHLYLLKPEGVDSLHLDGVDFMSYDEQYLDARGGGSKSKASRVLEFLEANRERAWFSVEIAETLKEHGVKIGDIMPNVRRFERRSQLYVRGYMLEERQTPFKEGYLITWMNPHQPSSSGSPGRTTSLVGMGSPSTGRSGSSTS